MTDSPLRAKGRAMRRNLMGAPFADKLDRQLYTDPIMEKFAALTQEMLFGTLWTSPGLDLKTRTLISVVSDTATGRTPELKLHLRFARNHGWTEDELVEALLHLLGYVGAPLVREALLVAKESFAEMRAEIRSRHNSELAALRHFGRVTVIFTHGTSHVKSARAPGTLRRGWFRPASSRCPDAPSARRIARAGGCVRAGMPSRAWPDAPRDSFTSSAPSASVRRSRRRAPTSGTISLPCAATQAIATCADRYAELGGDRAQRLDQRQIGVEIGALEARAHLAEILRAGACPSTSVR